MFARIAVFFVWVFCNIQLIKTYDINIMLDAWGSSSLGGDLDLFWFILPISAFAAGAVVYALLTYGD